MSVVKRDYLSRLQTLLVFLILNGMTETKLAILPFLCCWGIVKNSIGIAQELTDALMPNGINWNVV